MAIVPLPLAPGAEARALLHHLLEHADVVGTDAAGRTIIQLAVDNRILENLMTSMPRQPTWRRGPTTSPSPMKRGMVRRSCSM